MVRITVRDFGDFPLIDKDPETGEHEISLILPSYTGHSYDGGRLDIDGADRIWVSHQHSIHVMEI